MSKNYYIIPIFVPHEGCPHNCVFCNQNKITGVLKESVTASYVRSITMEYLKTINHHNATIEISFFGGTFTAINEEKQRELLTVAKEYKDKKVIDKIRMSTRPDAITPYILDYLKDYGVDVIELGVQSLNEEVLFKAGRGHSAKDVEYASKLIKEYGFILGHQIMPGLPLDNFNKDIETLEKSIKMKPEIVRIYPSLIIKDTPMEKMFLDGNYVPYTLEEAVNICKVMYTRYTENNIKVIRMGLQPTETINKGKDIIDGPFHPAFTELVLGSLFVDKIREELKDNKKCKVIINSKDIGTLYANKKIYFNKLLNEGYSIKVETSDKIERGNISIYI